ncbi:hypothetical protein RNAN_0931 [Rheinheimera nanhaiensis E407-8]|uniref:Uncharacterized protein n=1 Tax=Rheinheimera nanhaiensis E407-8 TaxID=562729 RepID=I1DV82_9GAMM|nr:hypothetical protein RNAN_0931 [Rheinheimera nanhaiensis E407-8]
MKITTILGKNHPAAKQAKVTTSSGLAPTPPEPVFSLHRLCYTGENC